MSLLTFRDLQEANRERGKEWGKGQEIPYLFNAVELGGEAGELVESVNHLTSLISAATGKALNAVKKMYRGDINIAGGIDREKALDAVQDELADVIICCSLLANKLDLNLGCAVRTKFNKTSVKNGLRTTL